jgi:hypothetical protein
MKKEHTTSFCIRLRVYFTLILCSERFGICTPCSMHLEHADLPILQLKLEFPKEKKRNGALYHIKDTVLH